MRQNLIPAMFVSLGISIASCNDNNNITTGTATETTITDSSHLLNSDNNIELSANFIEEAARGGMMEVELGKIAMQNAESKNVKDFGDMMVKDHSAANAELMEIAKSKNIMLAENKAEPHIDQMKSRKGVDFDKAYVEMMVEDHEKDVSAFEKATGFSDAAVSAFAGKTLPVLKKHLEAIRAIQAKMQK